MTTAFLGILLLMRTAPTADVPAHVSKYLERCAAANSSMVPLPFPPAKDDVGVFVPATENDPRHGHSVDVLEIVGPRDAILRAWYVPADAKADGEVLAEEPTFVDLWMHGFETTSLAVGRSVKIEGVFHVTGNKSFDTTCGGRSMPLVEPIDVEAYRVNSE